MSVVGETVVPDGDAEGAELLCQCHRVSRARIETLLAKGLRDLVSLQEHCLAGTGCGSCRQELMDLLASAGVQDT